MAPPKKKTAASARSARKVQTKLNFDHPPSSSPSVRRPTTTSFTAPGLPTPKPTALSRRDASPFQSTPPKRSSNFEIVIVTPSKKPRVDLTPDPSEEAPSATKLPTLPPIDLDDSEDGNKEIGTQNRRERNTVMWSDPLLNESEEPSVRKKASQSSKPFGLGAGFNSRETHGLFNKKSKRQTSLQNEESDEDEDVVTPARKRKPAPTQVISLSDSDDELKSMPLTRSHKGREKAVELPNVEEGEQDEDEDEDDIPVSSVRRSLKRSIHHKHKRTLVDLDSSDNDSDGEPSNNNARSTEDDNPDDLDDDIQLALKTPTVKSRTRNSGSSPRLTPYQKKLQILNAARAKKAGKEYDFTPDNLSPQRALYDSEESEPGSPVPSESNHGHEDDGDGDQGGASEVDDEENPLFVGNLDDELSDFIVEDDGANDLIGAPEIPIEFTVASHQDLKTSFKIYTSYILLTILLPHPPEQSEFIHACLRRLQTQIDVYGGSVLQSSVWSQSMLRAMKTRPELHWEECEPVDKCDACNRHHRNAKQMVQFRGARYDPVTLRDLDSDSEDSGSQDSLGNEIPPEDTWYYLGRHCFMRARMRHAFFHWKKDLRNHVAGELVTNKIINPDESLTDETIEQTQDMDDAEQEAWANGIVKNMQYQLGELYNNFKEALESAEKNMTDQRSGKWRSDVGLMG
ncbi:hypothetical protein EDC01DRAFT_237323 [Geopyxis carbonaria]|nr:hypothetical protein EDC01DRAFT_237323 [Geopyxis carbonaria]